MKRGHFSSNREEKGEDDIYSFIITKSFANQLILKCLITDAMTNQRLMNPTMQLLDNEEKLIAKVETNKNGEYTLRLEKGLDYKFNGELKDYFGSSLVLTTKELNSETTEITSVR
jgi:hypothetical protein